MLPLPSEDRFNPLPSPKQGETYLLLVRIPPMREFQSAPLTEARGDRRINARATGRRRRFQSAPLTEARGDGIHIAMLIPELRFNPLPSPKQGETRLVNVTGCGYVCFNPLPSPKQGETLLSHHFGRKTASFNPLPSPKQGETQQEQQSC